MGAPLMAKLIKKIHIYLGLLNLSIVLVFGLAGLKATFKLGGRGMPPVTATRYEPFTVPPSLADDTAVAEHVRAQLRIAAVIHDVRRDPDNNLAFAYYTHNGPHYVTILEKENRLRLAIHQTGMWSFFDNLHATERRDMKDWRVQLWAWYNEFSIWSLIAMALTGVYLWLASRPGFLWAQISFAVGAGAFLLLYFVAR